MVEWRVYGCGSPSSSYSTQSSYEIVEGNSSLHIDMGHGAIYRRCQREGSIESVIDSMENLLITHCHPDHFFDMSRLYVSWMYTPGFTPKQRVSLFTTQETLEGIRRMMGNTRLEGNFEKVFEPHLIDYDIPIQIGNVKVTPTRTRHIEGSCGVCIDTDSGKRIVFTSDTGFSEEILPPWEEVDLLVTECSFVNLDTPYHLHLGQVAQIVKRLQPECLLLAHFYPDMERKPEREIRDFLITDYAGDIHIARDGLCIRWDSQCNQWNSEMMF